MVRIRSHFDWNIAVGISRSTGPCWLSAVLSKQALAVDSTSQLTGDREGEHAGVPSDHPQQTEHPQAVDAGKWILCSCVADLLQVGPHGETDQNLHSQTCNMIQQYDTSEPLRHSKPSAELSRLQQAHHWTIEPTTKLLLNLRVYNKVTAELLNLQQTHHWTIDSTKLLLNHLVYKKDTTQPSILQQTHHWTIECTTELLLNRRVYNKITAEPLSL